MIVIEPGGNPEVEMRCELKQICESRQSISKCEQGVYDESCAYCCDEYDSCNGDILLPTAPPTTVAPSGQCAIVNHTYCMEQWKESIDSSAVDPTFYFAQFCRGMPDLVRCLMGATEDCCEEDIEYLKTQYDEILSNMTEMCPESCSESKAEECMREYYHEVLEVIIHGGDCDHVLQISIEKEYCMRMVMATCPVDTKESFNSTYWTIRVSAEAHCGGGNAWGHVNSTDGCDPNDATDCITNLGDSALDVLLNGTTHLEDVCDEFDQTETCYTEAIKDCDDDVKDGFNAGFEFTKDLVQEDCDKLQRPVCDTETARLCILALWEMVDVAEDFQTACNMINETQLCVDENTVGCTDAEKESLQRSLDFVLEVIGDRCDDIILCPPEQNITLVEGGPSYNLALSILRSASDICGGSENCKVYIDVDIEMGNSPRCRNGKAISQAVIGEWSSADDVLCSFEVTDSNWNQVQTVPIAAKLDFKIDGVQKRTLTIWIRVIIDGREEKRSLCNLWITIEDKDLLAQCRSVNDPHTTTFDDFYYNNFVEGHFILYQHKTLPYQVQIVGQRCNDKATCNCAVGVQSGDMVLFIDRCRKSDIEKKCKKGDKYEDKYDCKNMMEVSLYAPSGVTPGTIIMKKYDGKKWEVVLPHGTFVKISTNGDFLNVYVTPSPVDLGNTEGLCGLYNGIEEDDLTMRDGDIYDGKGSEKGGQPKDFLKDWRCKGNEKIYKGVSTNPYTPTSYCDCRTNDTGGNNCGPYGLLELCDFDISGDIIDSVASSKLANVLVKKPKRGGKPRLSSQSASRRLLQVEPVDDFDLDEDWEAPNITDGVYNSTTAEAKCLEVFDGVQVLQDCKAITETPNPNDLQSCIDDLRTTDDIGWVDSQIESMKEICTQTIRQDPKYSEDEAAIALANGVMAINCPNECSGNGQCANGVCTCTPPFTGQDCSFDMDAEPEDSYILNDGLCDSRENECVMVPVVGFGFIPDQTKCFVQKVEVNEDGVVIIDTQFTEVESVLVTLNMVYCVLPEEVPHYVQLSNNGGTTFSNQSLFIPKDYVCWSCDATVDPKCTRTVNSCIIEASCYADTEESSVDSCYQCDPTKSVDQWTYVCSTVPWVAIFVPIAVIVGVVLAIGIVVLVKRKRKATSLDTFSMPIDTSKDTASDKLPPHFGPTLQYRGFVNSGMDPYQVHPIDGMDIEEGQAPLHVDELETFRPATSGQATAPTVTTIEGELPSAREGQGTSSGEGEPAREEKPAAEEGGDTGEEQPADADQDEASDGNSEGSFQDYDCTTAGGDTIYRVSQTSCASWE